MRISVIIPAYNAARLLRRAITSALEQSLAPHEVIIIDDGSIDDTRAVAAGFAARVRYYFQPNQGASAARNVGIRESCGDWIAFLDADDEWFPHKLAAQAEILGADPGLNWCACAFLCGCHGAYSVIRHPSFRAHSDVPGPTVPYFRTSAGGDCFQTSGFIIARQVFDEVGAFDPALRVCHDRDLWWRIALRYPLIGYSPRACYRYDVSLPGSLTKTTPRRDQELRSLCDNMRRARALGAGVAKSFGSYARHLVRDYRLRAAGQQVLIDRTVIRESTQEFPVSRRERLLLATLSAMPSRLARPVVERLRA